MARWAVKLDFVGANAEVRLEGVERTPAVVSYFKGASFEGQTGLPTYSRVAYRDLWPGVDLIYSGTVNRLKYQFVLHPGADPAVIRLAYRGANVALNDAGQLEVSTPVGGFRDDKPYVYQERGGRRVAIPAAYSVDPAASEERVRYGFALGEYDASRVLIIDPSVLIYAGYIGGTALDRGADVAVDSAGNAYVTGETAGTAGFPALAGPDLTLNGDSDAFVAKVNAAGTALVYAGYLGGNGADRGASIAVDGAGAAYITGETESEATTFPTLLGPDLTFNGGTLDAFVAKINAAGTALLYAGYIGGEERDGGNGIAVDAEGQAYVVGETLSDEFSFPVAIGPDVTANGSQDGFVAKVNAAGTALLFAGYLGGEAADAGHDIAVWGEGEIFVTGETRSGEGTFPVTGGPDLTYNGGLTDAFVAQVRADGTVLEYAGYIGGELADAGNGIAVDADGQAHVTGNTRSTEGTFPVLRGPDLTHNGQQDAFAAKVASGGGTLIYAGYVGGEGIDSGNAVALDEHGNAHLTGGTRSTEATFPVTVGPDLTYNGGRDAFIAKIEITGPSITVEGIVNAATFVGGPIAPGEIISIFGVEIGPDPGVNTVFDENGNVPVEFAGVQVLINGVPAPLYFVGENQVNCQVPYEVDGTEQVTVQVIFNGTASNIVTIDVAETAPGLFTLENGIGQVIAVLFPEGTLNTAENPVAPGQIVTLYGTGEGQTVPAGLTGVPVDVPLPIPIADVVVRIGGVEQDILYVGGAPGFAGLLQLNIEIVVGTPAGPAVPIVVPIGGVVSAGALTPEAAAVESEKAAKAGGDVTISITGDPDDQGPVANGQMVMTDEDVALPITLTGSDPEGDALTFTITRAPANGTVSAPVATGPGSADVT